MAKIRKQEALDYHEQGRPGKIQVLPTKPYRSQRDLSLAYSPGVAEPCIEISANKELVYNYTAKGNLVAVITNGTAVLGLGDIGPEAAKPVMEGKGLLFKIYADIDVFDIEIDASDVDTFVNTVKAIAPTFGGINLEDIKAPEAFEIERRLKELLDIPVMHDDQHGTAIISGAALLNALEIAKKDITTIKILVNGAGAAAISCAQLYISLGAKKENILMFDSKGLISTSRKGLDERKAYFASTEPIVSLEKAFKDIDVFLGLSKGNLVTKEMIQSMAKNPIVFALANPDPEISYQDAIEARDDVIMATGRSDNPNQVNNVLGFPYIFRGAMDVRATTINEEMKLAAVYAIAKLAKEPVPEEVNEAYGTKNIGFGMAHIIPKPVDPRLITYVAPAVAKAAMESGVAKKPITDWALYKEELKKRLGLDNKLLNNISIRAKQSPKRVVFAEADNYDVLKAAQIARDEGIAYPILLGDENLIKKTIDKYNIELKEAIIIDPKSPLMEEKRNEYAKRFFEKRQRKGCTFFDAKKLVLERNYFGALMLDAGEADAMISGLTRNYKDVIRPALHVIGTAPGVKRVAGMYIMMTKGRPIFFADTTVNLDPTVEELVDITLLVAKAVQSYKITPKIGMLSYANFGSAIGKDACKVRDAVKILHKSHPEIIVDGELQANFALNQQLLNDRFPFSHLANKNTNTLIFPNLAAGNIAYKLVQEMGEAEAIGPVLLGMRKPFHVLQLDSSVREIVNLISIAVVDAQRIN